MRKVLAIVLTLALLLPTFGAVADVLNDGWKEAPDSDLQAAVAAINAELAARQSAKSPEEVQTITGHGTAIEQITVSTVPARVTLTCEDKRIDNPATLTGASTEIELNPWHSGIAENLISEAGTYTFMIETSDEWTLNIVPLVNVGTFPGFSGNSSAFTDMFSLSAPVIVALNVEPANDIGSFIVEEWYCTEWGWDYSYDASLIADLTEGEAYSYDMILKPVDGATAYAIKVFSNYDGLSWTIKAK